MSTEQARVEGTKVPAPKVAKVTVTAAAKGKPAKSSNKPAVVKVTMNASVPPKGKKPTEIPDGLPKKYFFKSTFNTSDIMHSPVEKTINMIDKILSGERLFTM